MFGFSDDFEGHFISAWQEPFTGFELKWIEVEICRQAMQPTNVTDLFERMKNKYPDLEEMHQSKFYRIVSSLVDDHYLDDRQEGRAKIIQTRPEGAKELGRISRYFFEILIDRVKGTLWQDLIQKITKHTGCLLDQRVIVLGPEYQTINTLIQECFHCNQREEPPEDQTVEAYQSKFHFLNYNSLIEGNTNSSSIHELENLSEWIFKEGYADVVVLFNALSVFEDEASGILKEANRVTRDGGKIVVFETTKEDSTLLSTFMRQGIMLVNYSNPDTSWELSEEIVSEEQIRELIANAGLSVGEEFPDVISTIYILE